MSDAPGPTTDPTATPPAPPASRPPRPLRSSGLAALAAAAALLTSLSLLGDTPDTRDSTEQMSAWFVAHRGPVEAGAVLLGAAAVALVWFATTVAGAFGPDQRTAARLVPGLANLVAVLMTVNALLYAGSAYVIGAEAPGSTKALFELTLVSTNLIAVPAALLVATVGWALTRAGRLGRWSAITSAVAALAIAGCAVGFRDRGFGSPDVGQQVLFQVLLLWLATIGVAGLLAGRRRASSPGRSRRSVSRMTSTP